MDQRIFNDARDAYRRGRSVLASLNGYIYDYNLISGFSADTMHLIYDFLVQYILLDAAIADGSFKMSEAEFIDRIVDMGQILSLDSSQRGRNWRWMIDSDYSYSQIVGIMRGVQSKAEQYIKNFCTIYGSVARDYGSRNYYDELTDCLADINYAFNIIDGTNKVCEKDASVRAVGRTLARYW